MMKYLKLGVFFSVVRDISFNYVFYFNLNIFFVYLSCKGGNKFVLKDLDDASKRYGIDLHTESFFW